MKITLDQNVQGEILLIQDGDPVAIIIGDNPDLANNLMNAYNEKYHTTKPIDQPKEKKEPTLQQAHHAGSNGWHQSQNSKQFHYFKDGIPLCRKTVRGFAVFIAPYGAVIADGLHSISRHTGGCKLCIERAAKEMIAEHVPQTTLK